MKSKEVCCFLALVMLTWFAFVTPVHAGEPDEGTMWSEGTTTTAVADDYEDEDPFRVESQKAADPLEKFNRAMFTFNDRLYFWFLKPVARVYQAFIPQGVRMCIRNAYHNAMMPVRFLNCTFQGKFRAAGTELSRFAINTTLGAGGLFDFAATEYQLKRHDEDFGQTLGYHGMQPKAFITWPFVGPSSVRDTFGTVVDAFLNPLTYVYPEFWVGAAVRGGRVVNNTSLTLGEYEDFKESALDPYVSMRDAFLQNRSRAIRE
ncbi:MAG: VacJ family lipoprotein [Syntrophobacteraceae bacterium]|jgi:phospholipid-binding lipoprotein MlaA|nr:VacJ family lipoprotein [Syntrophobacteraceae bacterium]